MIRLFVAVLVAALLPGVSRAQADVYLPCTQMPELIQLFQADHAALDRFYFVEMSPERGKRYQELCKAYLGKLEATDYNALSTGCKVDYILFRRDLNEEIHRYDEEARAYRGLHDTWFPFADTLYAMEKARRRGAKPDARLVAADFDRITRQLHTLETRLAADPGIGVADVRSAQSIIEGLKYAAGSVFKFYNGYDPDFSWWVPLPYRALDSSLEVYATAFGHKLEAKSLQKDSSGIVGNPIGRDEIVRQLRYEMIPYTPEELIDIANKEFAWCDKEMLKASRELGFGDNWKAALEKVKNTYVTPGDQPGAMMELYNESIAFLKDKDLVTIPPLADETWRMVMMSPRQQLINPFFYGGEEFSISYPTNTMNYDDRMMSMRGNNPHFSRATVHHELIAGHYLQQFSCEHYKTYRHFETPFWTEGWALYWERLLWAQGFPRSPEDRIGMLFWRMHRCARIIFSLNYHTGKWTPQQCIDFLVDRVGHERANAEGEVRRSFVGGYSPLYQVAYMIGGLQFEALKHELVDSGKMTFKQYHDAVLHENNLPVEMVRAILTNQAPAKDFETHWRFYTPPMAN
ncbi:DUF885 family protein [Dinghuibacter silviterrae]|uniref:Uncharacterized protein (DUF885 family) n=1 Tax=Dinghuibacter silviterrae TaxID=1539049 RepID=A0A4R8DVJ9_9BACT|nr:DUF885 family protein [Dinghuibacter silviterrae]TDX01221.1 uncharacterized protein (DUF885 family) [Dinghuibacter silviterrae]